MLFNIFHVFSSSDNEVITYIHICIYTLNILLHSIIYMYQLYGTIITISRKSYKNDFIKPKILKTALHILLVQNRKYFHRT